MNTITPKPRRGRPPKSANADRDTRAQLIHSGLEMLTECGFAAAGIDQILKKVGVPKGSFYYYFASKEAYGQAVIESYDHYFSNKLDRYLLDTSVPPLQRIANFVENAKNGMARHHFKRGCLVGNLGQEIGLLPDTFRPQLIDVFLSWQTRLETCLHEAQQHGDIVANSDCHQLAEHFWVGWEGAVSRARLIESASPLDAFWQYFLQNLTKAS